jgi:protease-4
MKKLREKDVPVVVSQGSVAESAGYSICLPSDRVFTTPFTITGSIGVISGWAWDDGIGGKVGISAGIVQRGSHADLRSGVRFPFLPFTLPQRPMNDGEEEIVRKRILASYDEFVARVAEGRGMEEARVRELAEGRVWMGGDALERGLVDEIGTLGDALDEARRRAGLGPNDEFTVREYPERRMFRLPSLGPSLPGLSFLLGKDPDGDEDAEVSYLRSLLGRPGEPMELVPPGQLPAEWMNR